MCRPISETTLLDDSLDGRAKILASWWLVLLSIGILFASMPTAAVGQWSAEPGETVRNAFGPPKRGVARTCQGACGVQCPSTCTQTTEYECLGEERLRRVRSYECGTHQGCRDHDNCLDRCSLERPGDFDCTAYCHSEAVNGYGLENALSWASGGGPFDGDPIVFEYTKDAPEFPEPVFRCPDGASLRCSSGTGRCVATDGAELEPVFDSYASGSMRISDFRSGPVCGGGGSQAEVCEQAVDIRVTGEDLCAGGQACTRYAVEFDYEGADPSAPLECSSSASQDGGDFIGNLLKSSFDSAPELDGETFEGNEGLGEILGLFQKVVTSADSPEHVQISMAPLDADGNPIESERVGTDPKDFEPAVPRSVDLPGASGHVVVPMYQLAETSRTEPVLTREVRCSHNGEPVLEATFRLHLPAVR